MKALIAVVAFPLKMLNMFGGIVAGVWLAILGEWGTIGYGFVGYIFASYAIGLIMMPGLAFGAPAAALFEKGRTALAFPLVLLSKLYDAAVLTGWCLLVLLFFVGRMTGRGDYWPLLIWSYAVAIGPLADIAQEEAMAGMPAASVATFFAAFAYVLAVVAGMLGTPLRGLVVLFAFIMAAGMLYETLTLYASLRGRAQSRLA